MTLQYAFMMVFRVLPFVIMLQTSDRAISTRNGVDACWWRFMVSPNEAMGWLPLKGGVPYTFMLKPQFTPWASTDSI